MFITAARRKSMFCLTSGFYWTWAKIPSWIRFDYFSLGSLLMKFISNNNLINSPYVSSHAFSKWFLNFSKISKSEAVYCLKRAEWSEVLLRLCYSFTWYSVNLFSFLDFLSLASLYRRSDEDSLERTFDFLLIEGVKFKEGSLRIFWLLELSNSTPLRYKFSTDLSANSLLFRRAFLEPLLIEMCLWLFSCSSSWQNKA